MITTAASPATPSGSVLIREFVPGVSLRSTPGYRLPSLRDDANFVTAKPISEWSAIPCVEPRNVDSQQFVVTNFEFRLAVFRDEIIIALIEHHRPKSPSARHRMGSTFLSLHYHLVFATKNRKPFIAKAWQNRLHEYLGGTVTGLGGFPQQIGGVADHVHLLVGLKATHCLADFLRELKKSSSIWIHEDIGARSFAWQEGYSAFTVSATSREAVRKYIAQQEEHHRVKSFREELVEMLAKTGIEYDPGFLD